MKRVINYLPFRFTLFIILGICFQFFTKFWSFGFIYLFFLLITLLLLLRFSKKTLLTIIIFLLFFFIGITSIFINNPKNYNNFYGHYIKKNSRVTLQIHKNLKSADFYDKYEAKIIKIDSNLVKGNILLNILKDSSINNLKIDDIIVLYPEFKELVSPLNPHQFSYKKYLIKKGIYHQFFTNNNEILKLEEKKYTLFGLAEKIRLKVKNLLLNYNFKTNELAVINALLLGQRQDISKQLIADYQNAGAVHILAISGLHIGIILMLLSFILKPLERLKGGAFLKIAIIIILLWTFAFISGLSASVVRAVTMFSFVAIGFLFKQKKIVEFSLITSLFLLLLIKPIFLFDIGFQLSYLAVFGIIWLQPKIYRIWLPKYRITNFFWKLFTVSIAAQTGILPLTIYYFKQFPSLFLISNLVIIPFLGAILIIGIVVIILALFNILPQLLAKIYGSIIFLLNNFVRWVSSKENYLFKDINISIEMVLLYYVFIFTGVYFLTKNRIKELIYLLVTIILLQSFYVIETNKFATKEEFIVFHKSRFSLFGKRIGNKLYLEHNLNTLNINTDYSIKNYRIKESIDTIYKTDFKNYLKFKNKEILIVDSLGIYKIPFKTKPIVILQYSPKINLERLIKILKPCKIIVDGSNYKNDILQWQKQSLKHHTEFYYTGQRGTFLLK